MKHARAIRRHHLARMKRKAKRVYKDHPNATHFANHLKMCSCPMCGNPRKWFGERSIQERKFQKTSDWH